MSVASGSGGPGYPPNLYVDAGMQSENSNERQLSVIRWVVTNQGVT